MSKGHFCNVFHEHGHHNRILNSLSAAINRSDYVVIVTLCGSFSITFDSLIYLFFPLLWILEVPRLTQLCCDVIPSLLLVI